MRDDDIDAEPDKLLSELLGAVASAVGITKLDLDVLALRIAEGAQTAPESISERMRRRRRHQYANTGQLSGLLCLRHKRARGGGGAYQFSSGQLTEPHSDLTEQAKR